MNELGNPDNRLNLKEIPVLLLTIRISQFLKCVVALCRHGVHQELYIPVHGVVSTKRSEIGVIHAEVIPHPH